MAKTNPAAGLIAALDSLRKPLAANSPPFPYTVGYLRDDARFPQVAAVYLAGNAVYQALHNDQAELDTTIAPYRQLQEIDRFIMFDVGQLDRLPAPPSILRKLDELIENLGGEATRDVKRTSNVPTFNLKTGVLTIGEKAYTATTSERHVLRVLVERQTATLPELQQAADRPDRVLKGLLKKYPALKKRITLPGRAGHGGYSTTIEPARTSP